jgi:serine phosphatase RsbU (regulator of sigma subunit)
VAGGPFEDDPSRLLELANNALIEKAGTSEHFVTAACLTYRPQEESIAWALAGHWPPLALDRGEPSRTAGARASRSGSRIGSAASRRMLLPPGSGRLLFTDGVLEARTTANGPELFGTDRLAELVEQLRGADPAGIVHAVTEAARRFANGRLSDDLCVLAFRARPLALSAPS